MQDKLSIVLFSGTVDKLMAATVITAGAAAMGKEVTRFLTFWALMAFRKDAWKTNTRLSKDFENYGAAAMQAMQEKKVPSFMQTPKDAKNIKLRNHSTPVLCLVAVFGGGPQTPRRGEACRASFASCDYACANHRGEETRRGFAWCVVLLGIALIARNGMLLVRPH
jgi:predicted peroxiredoxin